MEWVEGLVVSQVSEQTCLAVELSLSGTRDPSGMRESGICSTCTKQSEQLPILLQLPVGQKQTHDFSRGFGFWSTQPHPFQKATPMKLQKGEDLSSLPSKLCRDSSNTFHLCTEKGRRERAGSTPFLCSLCSQFRMGWREGISTGFWSSSPNLLHCSMSGRQQGFQDGRSEEPHYQLVIWESA